MSSNTSAAGRVATTIGVVKWLVVAAYVVTGVIALLVTNAQTSWPTWTAAAGPLTLVGCLIAAGVAWVLFGWFQHSLSMLVTIAGNTAPAAYDYQPPAHDPEVQVVR